MVRRAKILIGNFGDDITFGVKTAPVGYDVRDTGDDFDPEKRSFNSQWPNIGKLKIIGAGASDWSQYQSQGDGQESIGGILYFYRSSTRGWGMNTPVAVPTGLTDIPIWEDRVFDPIGGYIYDDYLYAYSGSGGPQSSSGARSYHSGPSTSPANTIWLTPYAGVPNAAAVENVNKNYYRPAFDPVPPYPAYPAYPTKPTNRPALAYVIYSNELGEVT